MIRIRDIDHLVLRVIDLDRMLRFYCGVLGCTVERRDDAIGLVQLRAGRALLDLVPVSGKLGRAGGAPPAREGRNLDHFCFRVEPFDEAASWRPTTWTPGRWPPATGPKAKAPRSTSPIPKTTWWS